MVPCHHITRLMFITERISITSLMQMKSTCQSDPQTGLSVAHDPTHEQGSGF